MEGVKLYGGSSITVLLQNERLHCPSEPFEPLWPHTSEPSFQGSRSVVNFENVGGSMVMDRPFFQPGVEREEKVDDDDLYEGCFHQSKKRRLTSEQVQFLERNFEVENKLDPERKIQLAKDLGLHPRQVAIWFQNRRARFKTKQIERDYGALKASFDRLKSEHDNLVQENQRLKEEVNSLKKRLVPREKEEENFGDKLIDSEKIEQDMDLVSNACSKNESTVAVVPMMVMCKQEDANSAKSDVLDSSDSPNYSDFSQDEEDNMNHDFFTTLPFLPKLEDDDCYHAPHDNNSCNFGFPIDDPTVFGLTESYYY